MRSLVLLAWLVLSPLLQAAENPKTVIEGLPATIQGLEKGETKVYEGSGLGVSNAYQKDGLLISVYVYDLDVPNIGTDLSDPTLKTAFEDAKQSIVTMDRYKDVELREDGMARYGKGYEVLRARYQLTRKKDPDAGERFNSEVYVFGAKGNIIKLRTTYTIEDAAEHQADIEAFIPKIMDLVRAGGASKKGSIKKKVSQ